MSDLFYYNNKKQPFIIISYKVITNMDDYYLQEIFF